MLFAHLQQRVSSYSMMHAVEFASLLGVNAGLWFYFSALSLPPSLSIYLSFFLSLIPFTISIGI